MDSMIYLRLDCIVKMQPCYIPAVTRIWPWNVPGAMQCYRALTHDLEGTEENVKNFMYMAYKGHALK